MKKQAAAHLAWAMTHKDWTRDDWAKVIWSDETLVKSHNDSRVKYVFWHQTKKEKYAPQNIRRWKKGSGVSKMIWACFINDKLGPFICIDGSVTKNVYQ